MNTTSYYTSCGKHIQFAYQEVTLSTIDHLAQYYFMRTNRVPTVAFTPPHSLRAILADTRRYAMNSDASTIGYMKLSFRTHMGEMTIRSSDASVLDFFVGTEEEYEQTKIDHHFEEIVLQAD